MDAILTISEIFEQYDSEWVLLENPELDQHLRVVTGRVVWHTKDRDELYQKALELRPRKPAFLYTGRIPDDTAVVLCT